MHEISIDSESEGATAWTFGVTVFQDGKRYPFQATLDFRDYDLWCRGRLAPERVVRAAFEFLLLREPACDILPRFDCAVIRRYFPDVDQRLPQLL